MILELNKDIDLKRVKNSLKNNINSGFCRNGYTFEVNLIYKIIHDHSNYEDYQWTIYGFNKDKVERELKSLLIDISKLDQSLTWDCLSIFYRYKNLINERHRITKKYIRSDI